VSDVFEVMDVFGEPVQLPEARWTSHVLASHPEMQPHLESIQQAIQTPHFVLASDSAPSAKLFYQCGAVQDKYKNLYLKVVVSYALSRLS
jgi:hypothetical protein